MKTMNLKEIYEETDKRIRVLKEQGNTIKIREEQLYFTGVTMGIVARTDNTYKALKSDPELTNKSLKKGIKDAENIELSDNVIFESMCYAKSIDDLTLTTKDQNE